MRIMLTNMYIYKITTIPRAFWLARLYSYLVLDRVSLKTLTHHLPGFSFPPANYFNEIFNAFPCDTASSKHLGSWENTSSVWKHEAQLVFVQRSACLDEATLRGNALYLCVMFLEYRCICIWRSERQVCCFPRGVPSVWLTSTFHHTRRRSPAQSPGELVTRCPSTGRQPLTGARAKELLLSRQRAAIILC